MTDYEDLVKAFAREISRQAYAHSVDQVYRDFLEVAVLNYRTLPLQVRHIMSHGQPMPCDAYPAEAQKVYAGIEQRYGREMAARFSEWWGVLQCVPNYTPVIRDFVGEVYERLDLPKGQGIGQFFTPWPVAVLMAKVLAGDLPERVYAAITAALKHPDNADGQAYAPLWEALILPGLRAADRVGVFPPAPFWRGLERALSLGRPFFQPVAVDDSASGSFRLPLAVAAELPRWMATTGVVRFYGQDIDPDAVNMARVNTFMWCLGGVCGPMWRALGQGFRLNLNMTQSAQAHTAKDSSVPLASFEVNEQGQYLLFPVES